jgi:hypothetical protein
MTVQQLISLVLDIVLVVVAVVAYAMRPRIGGELAKGLRILLIGLMILGLDHLLETGLFIFFQLDLATNEIIHRLTVVVAFGFVILGFSIMRRAFEN